jgi:hypothetical protein
MTISKNEFKIIYNHMKTLSSYNIQNLINQVEQGKTNNDDINQIIYVNSSKQVAKLMSKINTMLGGAETSIIDTSSTEGFIQENIKDIIEKLSGGSSPEIPQDKAIDLELYKENIRNIIEKLKIKYDLLKEKENELIERENKITAKENINK